ncbi:hypothetical protein NQD34_012722 [Periophthalmus magnuspinnatus]|nr:hypothetical protein NQD34_012722 [Periophthalmus magnuspinnatus]
MILLTMFARVSDGLPLAASIQENEQYERDLQQYQTQAKQLFRRLNAQSPDRCTLEAGNLNFHYLIAEGVCYLCLCEPSFPKKVAFGYLDDLHSEFFDQYGRRVSTVTRPYAFIEFGKVTMHYLSLLFKNPLSNDLTLILDNYIQKAKKMYVDGRARRNLGNINTELQDVQRIMVANIEEVLHRGEALSVLDTKASNLSSLAKKYQSDAKYLNTRSTYAKFAAVAVVLLTLIIYVRFWWL